MMAAKAKRARKSGLTKTSLAGATKAAASAIAASAIKRSAASGLKPMNAGGKISISTVLKAEMPGWKLATEETDLMPGVEDSDMKSEMGPSIAQLRSKFLGGSEADAVDSVGDALSDVDTSVESVRIQPSRGGPAKTADIKNGKVSIVQG